MALGVAQSLARTFDPSQLPLTGYWRAPYTGAPWVGSASQGISGGRTLGTVGLDPNSNAALAVQKYTPINCTVSSQRLQSPDLTSTFFSIGNGGSGFVLYNNIGVNSDTLSDSFSLAGGHILLQCAASCTLTIANTGASNSATTSPRDSISGGWGLCQFTANSSQLRIRLNGGTWITSVGTTWDSSALGLLLQFGDSNTGFVGSVLEMGMTNMVLPDATFDSIRNYCRGRYMVSV